MTPAQSCRQICGLTLADVSRAVNKHANTLAHWHKYNYHLFFVVCLGVLHKKKMDGEL